MKLAIRTLAIVSSLLLLGGCASTQKVDPVLEKKIEAQVAPENPSQMMYQAAVAFSNAPGLTEPQKAKLTEIYNRVFTESSQIRTDIGKTKSLLFLTLANPNYKPTEVKEMKNRIVALDQKRMTIMFKALDQVQEIVGHGAGTDKIYRHFEDYEFPRNHELQ